MGCPVRRYPGMIWQYEITADERLVEADHVALVYEKTSKWQNIKIYKNREFGNVLYLDDDISKYNDTIL
jgi:spermidine synthase